MHLLFIALIVGAIFGRHWFESAREQIKNALDDVADHHRR